jgi:hypothetical protein
VDCRPLARLTVREEPFATLGRDPKEGHMPVIDVGLRPSDHVQLKELAAREGRRLQDQAAILLEQAIRDHAGALSADDLAEVGPTMTTAAAGSRGR